MPDGRQPALVTPSVLSWARETARMDISYAAGKLKRDEQDIKDWEAGKKELSLAQARKLANLYKRPLAIFYLPNPPKTKRKLPDLRQLPDGESAISYGLEMLMRRFQFRQEWLRDYRIEAGYPQLAFVGSASLETPPLKLAKEVRRHLSIPLKTQVSWPEKRVALNAWVAATERLGVCVCRQGGITSKEVRGMVIADSIAPFIFLNSDDSFAGRIFTLIHELTHVFLGESGISNPSRERRKALVREDRLERYCDKVAAYVLLPPKSFNLTWESLDGLNAIEDQIKQAAKKYSVSEEAVARRLLNNGIISDEDYRILRRQYLRRWEANRKHQQERMKASEGGPSPHLLRAMENGRSFSQVVLNAYGTNQISGNEAAGLLNTKVNHFGKIAEKIGLNLPQKGGE